MEGEENSLSSHIDDPSINKRAKMDMSDSDRLLNFATAADEFELSLKRQKIPRDPMSHRIIEKRRRDRMNNCLADLSRLIPASYHKQGQGRIEKTEIIEMAIKHINMLQQRADELEKKVMKQEKGQGQVPVQQQQQVPISTPTPVKPDGSNNKFYLGFREAQDEVMRFLVEVESINTMDPFCKKIMKHLENASQKFVKEIAHYPPPPPQIVVEKTESSNLDTECSNHQSQMFSTNSAFYSTASGVPPGVTEEGPHGMDMKRDERLRNLLGDQQNPMVGRVMAGSNTEVGDDRRGTVPLFSYSGHLSGVASVVGSSGYISDMSNLEKNSPNSSTSSRENVYKFKHNITKRFSQEGHHHHHHQRYSHHHPHMQHHHHQPSDTSSNTSSRDLEDDQGQLRWKGRGGGGGGKHKSCSVYTDDIVGENVSPNSDECNSGSNCSDAARCHRGSSAKGRQTSQMSTEEQASSQSVPTSSSSSVALPGFILHPSGTHYMPISVHNTDISGLFESAADQEGMPVFHPISIPVHFRRPVISMPNITICTHLNSKSKDTRNNKE